MFKFTKDFAIRTTDGAWIPMDESNADYREYLEWVAEGNTAEPLNLDTETTQE